MNLQNEDGAFIDYWSALVLTTIPGSSGNLDPVSKFVQVRHATVFVSLHVFSLGNIVGCTHVSEAIVYSCKTPDERNEQWIVNSYIDLATWYDVYKW